MRALAFLLLLGCANPKLSPTTPVRGGAPQDAGPCGVGGVEMDDCHEHAPLPDGGACDVECRSGKLCLVNPAACRSAPINVGPTEYLAPK